MVNSLLLISFGFVIAMVSFLIGVCVIHKIFQGDEQVELPGYMDVFLHLWPLLLLK